MMTKVLYFLPVLIIGCGSADTDFGAAASVSVAAAAPDAARAFHADGGHVEPSCGPVPSCADPWRPPVVGLSCHEDSDCCRGEACRSLGGIMTCLPAGTCRTDADCPCHTACLHTDAGSECWRR